MERRYKVEEDYVAVKVGACGSPLSKNTLERYVPMEGLLNLDKYRSKEVEKAGSRRKVTKKKKVSKKDVRKEYSSHSTTYDVP